MFFCEVGKAQHTFLGESADPAEDSLCYLPPDTRGYFTGRARF
jgi:hypothetical protein